MPNPTLELIGRHGSARYYKSDPVPGETVEILIAAAQRTSSSSNLQAYSVIAVTDATKRARLAELCGNQEHIAQAPVFLAWCADLARLDRACELRGYTQVTDYVENFLVAAVDAAIAAQTAALAAESLGLGICYIGSIRNNTQAVIDLLELPRLVFPITGMTVGWPAAQPPIRPRLPLRGVLHWEHYDRTAEDESLRDVRSGHGCHRHLPGPTGADAGQAGRNGRLWLDGTFRSTGRAGDAGGVTRSSGTPGVRLEVSRDT